MIGIAGALRREQALIAAGIFGLVAISWAYIWQGAGMGMSALDMTTLSLFPHLQADIPGTMDADWPVVIGMWWVMMIAMMTPSAAPLVLLYGLVLRRHPAPDRNVLAGSFLLLAGYLSVWLLFSVAAAALQRALEPAGLISGMMLWSRSAVLSAAVLAAAGLYQYSPLKHACLRQCQGPVRFLTEHWRPGRFASFFLGLRHGAFCLGCCWLLMALLFVGGVMNLIWIGVLTVLVLLEKLLPGQRVGHCSGAILLGWAAATLLV